MMKKLGILSVMMLFLSSVFYAQTKKIEGLDFNEEKVIGKESLILNGGGLREKYFIDLYVGVLYLPKKSSNAEKIINADETQAVQIKLVSGKVTRDKFTETVKEGFKNASHGKATQEEIKAFMKLFSDEFKVWDKISLEYTKEKGVSAYKNGHYLGSVGGLEFKKALFSIWLGSNPADSTLKSGMLGKE